MAYRLERPAGERVLPDRRDDGAGPEGLPYLPAAVVHSSLRRISPEDASLTLKHKLVPAAWLPHRTYYAAASDHALEMARTLGLTVVGKVQGQDYRRGVMHAMGRWLLPATTLRLDRQSPLMSNRRGPGIWQKVLLVMLMAGGLLTPLLPASYFHVAAGIPAAVLFLAIISLRLMCILPHAPPLRVTAVLRDAELPVYSVLVPLFRETAVLPQLIRALSKMDYPSHLLDIKLILEESDSAMHRAVSALTLPDHFDIIVVPSGKPQTKPRALNYALAFARGELVTIYDAEDLPQPQQLREAAEAFATAPAELACLQAELRFFNARQCWLAQQFAIEYGSLFRVVLPALAAETLPLPLGGTSNHFRRNVLEAVGAWDPFNVTEDADLGIRLARAGFQTGVLASHTLEEANVSVLSWIKQRSRWLKGFLLTWLVHMRQPVKLWRELGPSGFWAASVMTLGVFLSAALHPLFLIKALWDFAVQPQPDNLGSFNDLMLGIAIVLFGCGYAVAFATGRLAFGGKVPKGFALAFATMPFYWLLLMPAAWLAFYEALFMPFHWHKTQHGLGKDTEDQERRAALVIAP